MKRPIFLYLLLAIILLLSLSALFGGFSMITDPTGKSLQFPENALSNSPFSNYFIPGMILFLVIGVFAIIIFFGLLTRFRCGLGEALNIFKEYHWSLSFSIYLGFLTVGWITIQTIWAPYFFLQPIISIIGLLIIFLSLLVRNFYRN